MNRAKSYYSNAVKHPVLNIRKQDKFHLDDKFLEKFHDKEPEWGPVGKFTFKRTYARPTSEENSSTEEFWQTLTRIVNGIYTVQKWHCRHHNLPWSDSKAQRSAQIMFMLMWDFKFLPGGRGLWMMGTEYVENYGSACLNNCSYVTTADININFAEPFCFLMDYSMLGVGVGSDCRGAGKVIIQQPEQGDDIHVVADSREGWVDLLFRYLEAYAGNGSLPASVDYSEVRPYGALIKGFGGTASGPDPLRKLIDNIQRILIPLIGKPITSEAIVDICDFVGVCVVAGNVRRCLPANTLVHTNKGLVRVQDIRQGDMVLTSGANSNKYMPVTAFSPQGEQGLLEIQTQIGPFRCTAKHKIAVMTTCGIYDFKMAKNLEIGDRMVFVDAPIDGQDTSLPSWHYDKPAHSTTCVDISVPSLDNSMAWFLGHFLGDGYTYANRANNGFNAYISVAVANDISHDEMSRRVRSAISSFGVNINEIEPSDRDNCRKIRAQSKQLAWYIDENFKRPHESMGVPECILLGKETTRAAFLAGLFDAEGSAGNRPVIACASVYPDFLRQVRAVYASLGIATRLRLHHPAQNNMRALYDLSVVGKIMKQRFTQVVLPHAVKVLPETEFGSQFDYGYPTEWIKESLSYADWNGKWTPSNKQMTVATYTECNGDSKGLTPIVVLGVDEVDGLHETFDIEVAGAEEFVAEGMLVHNTALILFGDKDDNDFLNLKNPKLHSEAMKSHRWSSNNSIFAEVGMDYSTVSAISAKAGEPGYMWLDTARNFGRTGEPCDDSRIVGTNPCQPAWATVLTPDGIRTIGDIEVGSTIWSGGEWTKVTKKWSTGVKPVIAYKTRGGSFYGTENHRIVQEGEKVEVGEAEAIDISLLNPEHMSKPGKLDQHDMIDGLVLGDGDVHRASGDLVLLAVGKDDQDYFSSEVADLLIEHRPGVKDGHWSVNTFIKSEELAKTYEREIPARYVHGAPNKVRGFLRGLYSANGSVCANRVTLNASSVRVIEQAQQMLSSLGIRSYYTINRAHDVKFANGTYTCRESYDLNIGPDRAKFRELIGFIHADKTRRLNTICDKPVSKYARKKPKTTYDIVDREELGEQEVFDITVDCESHTYWTGGLLVSNCGEVSLESAELCNLSELFPSRHASYEEFERTIKYAYLYAKTVSLIPTHNPKTNAVMLRNRRIGLSQSGIIQSFKRHGRRKHFTWCNQGYNYVAKLDRLYSEWLCIRKSIKTTTVKPAGCRPLSSYVTTDQGILTLAEVMVEHPIDEEWHEVSGLTASGINKPLTKSLRRGQSEVYEICLRNGRKLTSTPNHPWGVKQSEGLTSFVRTDQITTGNQIVCQPGTYNSTSEAELVTVCGDDFHPNANTDITQPTQMTENLGWLIGALYGNGSFSASKHRVRFVHGELPIIEHYKVLMLKTFGLDIPIIEDSRGGRSYCDVGNKLLFQWFESNGLRKPKSKHLVGVPAAIRRSSQNTILAFIAGYADTDGCFSRGSFCIDSASESMMRSLQVVAEAVGISMSITHNTKGENFQDKKSIWKAHTSRVHTLNFARDRINALSMKARRSPIVEPARFNGNQNPHEVVSVRRLSKPVYTGDVEVADDHTFYEGGLLSHNTTSLLPGVTPGIHYEHAEYYYRTIRVAMHNPLVEEYKNAGHRVEVDVYDRHGRTAVIYFPVKAKMFDRAKSDVSIWEQMENAAHMQKHWSDNSVSITVTFKPEEADDIERVLELYESRLKTVSFLPLTDHGYEQAPYITITKEEYESAISKISEASFEGVGHDIEATPKFCSNDSCEMPVRES
jgi:intein/homing endonuclease